MPDHNTRRNAVFSTTFYAKARREDNATYILHPVDGVPLYKKSIKTNFLFFGNWSLLKRRPNLIGLKPKNYSLKPTLSFSY